MVNLTLVASSTLTMTSREIADLTGRRHKNVLRDIDALLETLGSDLSQGFKTSTYKDSTGKENRQFEMDRDSTFCVVAGYDANARMRIIKRWQELESGHAIPKVADPTLAALVQTVVELDQVKQQHAALARKTEILETRVQNVELQHRNGVPEGYLSKKEAHHLYGVGLSEEIFECLLVKVGVTSKRYMHLAEGYKTPCTAYLEAEIQPAVEAFLEDAVQCSAVFCMSPMLDGKRFRYVKETFSKEAAA